MVEKFDKEAWRKVWEKIDGVIRDREKTASIGQFLIDRDMNPHTILKMDDNSFIGLICLVYTILKATDRYFFSREKAKAEVAREHMGMIPAIPHLVEVFSGNRELTESYIIFNNGESISKIEYREGEEPMVVIYFDRNILSYTFLEAIKGCFNILAVGWDKNEAKTVLYLEPRKL